MPCGEMSHLLDNGLNRIWLGPPRQDIAVAVLLVDDSLKYRNCATETSVKIVKIRKYFHAYLFLQIGVRFTFNLQANTSWVAWVKCALTTDGEQTARAVMALPASSPGIDIEGHQSPRQSCDDYRA